MSTSTYQQIQNQYGQQQQQQTQSQNFQHQQGHANYYQQQQQPTYTSIVQQGPAAWSQSKISQQENGYGGVVVGQGQSQGNGGVTGGYNQTHATSSQPQSQYSQQQQLQFSQLQYTQNSQQQAHGQGQQYVQHSIPHSINNDTGPGLGSGTTSNDVDGSATKRRQRSRFSVAPTTATPFTPSTAAAVSSSVASRVQESYSDNSYTNKPSAAAIAAATAESAKPANWPVSLKRFVDRSFAFCKTDANRKFAAETLEKIINKVAYDGRMTAHKWDLEDITSLIIPPLIIPKQAESEKQILGDKEKDRAKDEERDRERDRNGKPVKMDPSLQTTSYRYYAPPSLSTGSKGGGSNGYNAGTYGANSMHGVSNDFNGQNGAGFSANSSPANSRYGPSSAEHSALPSPSNSHNGILYQDGAKKRKNRWETDSNNNDDAISVVSDSYYSVQSKDSSRHLNNYQHHEQIGAQNGKYKLQSSSTDKYDSDGKKSLQNKKKKNGVEESCRALTSVEQAVRDKRANRFKETEEETKEPQYVRYTALESQSFIQLGKKSKPKKKFMENAPYDSQTDNSYYNNSSSGSFAGEFDFESLIVIGSCQKIEKDYFRLTSAPLPNTVRPEFILRQSLSLVKNKWDNSSVEYVYMCSQFKSMRQDLTVQHIQNGKKILLVLLRFFAPASFEFFASHYYSISRFRFLIYIPINPSIYHSTYIPTYLLPYHSLSISVFFFKSIYLSPPPLLFFTLSVSHSLSTCSLSKSPRDRSDC